MGVTPYFFQRTHRGICCGNFHGDVIIVMQVVEDGQAQVSKSLCEAEKAVNHLEVFVSSSWSYFLCLRFVCPGLCSSLLSEELILHHPLGWYAASDFERMCVLTCPPGREGRLQY
jgi:hypothetical protein